MKCSNSESLGRLIYFTAQEIKNYAEKVLKPYALTLEQFHILKNMAQDSGMSQRALGERVNKTPANITRILDRLESKNLIVRRRSPGDRRTSMIYLTDSGQSLVNEVFGILESFSTQLTGGISQKDQQLAGEILGRINHNINSIR